MSIDKQYIKGFNHGYILAEHDPQLAKQIVKHPNVESEYFKGIVSGKQEYDLSRMKQRMKTVSKNQPSKSREIKKGKDI